MASNAGWQSGRDYDGILPAIRSLDGPTEEAPSPRSRALAAIAESSGDTVADQQTLIRELQSQINAQRIAMDGLTTERARLVTELANVIEQRDGALAQSAELLDANLQLHADMHGFAERSAAMRYALDRARQLIEPWARDVDNPPGFASKLDAFLFNDLCEARRAIDVALAVTGKVR